MAQIIGGSNGINARGLGYRTDWHNRQVPVRMAQASKRDTKVSRAGRTMGV